MLWFDVSLIEDNYVIKPNALPKDKEEAILAIKALGHYLDEYNKPILNVKDFNGYFNKIQELITE